MGDLRIVLLGKTGSGKSAAGNAILGKECFEAKFSLKSVTSNCQAFDGEVNGQKVRVIDTPGLWDTETGKKENKSKIEKLFNDSGEGLVILLVIRLDVRLTQEEQDTIKWIQENFGEEATKYTIVLFTHGDALPPTVTIENCINEDNNFKTLVKQCNERYHVFNNKDKDQNQVTELLRKVNELQEKNEGQGYNKQHYDAAQEKIALKNGLIGAGLGGLGGAIVGGGAGGIAVKTGVAATMAKAIPVGLATGGVGGAVVVGVGAYCLTKRCFKKDNKKQN